MAHPLWPLFDLRIRSDHLVLRLPTDDELVELAGLARSGIHDPDEMPFGVPWSTRPSPEFETGFIQHHWSMRATFAPEKWWLNLAVERGGSWVAAQTIAADNFPVFRTVDTGSWVAQRYQRQGIGKEMRGAVLAFAFDHLGARLALSEAFVDNAASNAVSRSLGYEPNGFGQLAPENVARETLRYRMTLERWRSQPRPTVEVEGLDRCRALLGLGGPAEPGEPSEPG